MKLTDNFRSFCAMANNVQFTADFRPTWREVAYALCVGALIQLVLAIFAIGIVMEAAWLVSYFMPAAPFPSLPPLPGVGQ